MCTHVDVCVLNLPPAEINDCSSSSFFFFFSAKTEKTALNIQNVIQYIQYLLCIKQDLPYIMQYLPCITQYVLSITLFLLCITHYFYAYYTVNAVFFVLHWKYHILYSLHCVLHSIYCVLHRNSLFHSDMKTGILKQTDQSQSTAAEGTALKVWPLTRPSTTVRETESHRLKDKPRSS